MKTFAFAVLIAVVAASPALAAKKKRAAAPPPASASNNENSWRFARDSLPIFVPTALMPVYVATTNNPTATKKSKK